MSATILIVEDDAPTLSGLASVLENAGYTVIPADSYAAGQRALQTRAPDLLVVDIRLGEFNGLQLIATRPRPIPSIVITGYPDVVLERDARRFGAQYLVKPIAPQGLLAVVRAQLENQPVARTERRWPRTQVVPALPVWVNQWSGRLLDISYGGARLEVDDGVDDVDRVPNEVYVSVPSRNVTLSAHVVWTAGRDGAGCILGAELATQDSVQAAAWRELVNRTIGV